MKNPFFVIFLSFLIAMIELQSVLGKDAPTSESQLLKEFEAALKAKDRDALLSLFNWQGVSADMKSFQGETIAETLTNAVKGVKLLPLPADFQPTNELDGVRYTPNVSIVGVVDVQFAREGNSMQMPYGKKGNAFYIAGTTEERFATPAAKERFLNVSVMGATSVDGDTFTGSYMYVKGGKEIKANISGKGNRSEAFRGDYIKSCTVQKTSDKQAWIQVVISEGGKKIFESKRVETKDPIVYEKK